MTNEFRARPLHGAAKREGCSSFKAAALLVVALFLTGFTLPAQNGTAVTVAWNASADTAVAGYRLYEGVSSRTYTNSVDVGNATSFTITGLAGGTTYYFAVTAYDAQGLESDFSDEVVYTVPFVLVSLALKNCWKLPSGNFTITASATNGQTCVLFGATNLAPPVTWVPIGTNTADARGVFTCDDLTATNYSHRFYRALAR